MTVVPRRSWPRSGFTLVEAVVASICTFVVIHLVISTQITIAAGVRGARERGTGLASIRAARVVLRSETVSTSALEDWVSVSGDSLVLRAVRGGGYACGGVGPPAFTYAGVRSPNAVKDSLLVLTGTGEWRVAALTREGPVTGCGAWTLDPPVPDGVAFLLFERGSYHIDAGTLRYRVGRGGRQPLTEPGLGRVGMQRRSGEVAVVPRP